MEEYVDRQQQGGSEGREWMAFNVGQFKAAINYSVSGWMGDCPFRLRTLISGSKRLSFFFFLWWCLFPDIVVLPRWIDGWLNDCGQTDECRISGGNVGTHTQRLTSRKETVDIYTANDNDHGPVTTTWGRVSFQMRHRWMDGNAL